MENTREWLESKKWVYEQTTLATPGDLNLKLSRNLSRSKVFHLCNISLFYYISSLIVKSLINGKFKKIDLQLRRFTTYTMSLAKNCTLVAIILGKRIRV